MSVKDRGDRQGGIGPFVTFVDHVGPDGLVVRWESRRHRKQPEAHASRPARCGGA